MSNKLCTFIAIYNTLDRETERASTFIAQIIPINILRAPGLRLHLHRYEFIAPLKSLDILALYKFDYYYYIRVLV